MTTKRIKRVESTVDRNTLVSTVLAIGDRVFNLPDGTLHIGNGITAGGLVFFPGGGSGGITTEVIRDTVAAFMVASTGVTLVHNDAGDTLTVAADPEYIRDTIATFVTAGTGITVTHDDLANTFTIAATGAGGATDAEIVRDTIATALVAGAGVTIVPNDVADTIAVAADPEFIRDTVAAALVAGTNVTITNDDTANTITIAATGGGGASTETFVNALSFAGADNGAKLIAALAGTAAGKTLFIPNGTYNTPANEAFVFSGMYNVVCDKNVVFNGLRTRGNTTPTIRIAPNNDTLGAEGRSVYYRGNGARVYLTASGTSGAANALIGAYAMAINDTIKLTLASATGFSVGQTVTQGNATGVVSAVSGSQITVVNVRSGNFLVELPSSTVLRHGATSATLTPTMPSITNGTNTTTVTSIQGNSFPIIGMDIYDWQLVGGMSADGTVSHQGLGIHGGPAGTDPRSETLFVRVHATQITGGCFMGGSDGTMLYDCHGIPHTFGSTLVGEQPFVIIDKIRGAYINGIIGGTTQCRGGALRVVNGDQFLLRRCQMEHSPNVGTSVHSMLEVVGQYYPVIGGMVEGNNFGCAVGANALEWPIKLLNCQAIEFSGNTIFPTNNGDLFLGTEAHGTVWHHNPLRGNRALINGNLFTDATRRLQVGVQGNKCWHNQHIGIWTPILAGDQTTSPPTGNFVGYNSWVASADAAFYIPPGSGKVIGKGKLTGGNNASSGDFVQLPQSTMPGTASFEIVVQGQAERRPATVFGDAGTVILTATGAWATATVYFADLFNWQAYQQKHYNIGP